MENAIKVLAWLSDNGETIIYIITVILAWLKQSPIKKKEKINGMD